MGKACPGWAFYSLGIREYFPSIKRLILPYCTQIKLKNNSGSIFNGWIVRKFVFSKPPSRNLKNPDHPQSDLGLIRKLITTDINSYFLITGNLMVVVHCFRYLSDICNFVPLPHFENTLSRGLGVFGVRLKKVLYVDAKDIVQCFLYNGMAIGHWHDTRCAWRGMAMRGARKCGCPCMMWGVGGWVLGNR